MSRADSFNVRAPVASRTSFAALQVESAGEESEEEEVSEEPVSASEYVAAPSIRSLAPMLTHRASQWPSKAVEVGAEEGRKAGAHGAQGAGKGRQAAEWVPAVPAAVPCAVARAP